MNLGSTLGSTRRTVQNFGALSQLHAHGQRGNSARALEEDDPVVGMTFSLPYARKAHTRSHP